MWGITFIIVTMWRVQSKFVPRYVFWVVKPYRLAGGHLQFSKNAAFIFRVKMC